MRSILTLLIVLTAYLANAQGLVSNNNREIAFTAVNVVPMDKPGVIANQTVVVKNGKITAMGKAGQVKYSKDAIVVDAKGKYLVPGWSEMHAHVPPGEDLTPMKEVLMLYLANGITNIRGMLGVPKHLELRDKINSGVILGPHFITSGPSFSGQSIRSPERGVELVRQQKEAGYDFLKLHPGLTKATFPGIAKTAKEVGIPFAGHVSFNVGVWAAIESGYATIDHMDGFIEALTPGVDTLTSQEAGFFGDRIAYRADASKIPALMKALKEKNIRVVPTEALAERWMSPKGVEHFENDPDLKYMDKNTRDNWAKTKRDYNGNAHFDKAKSEALIKLRHQLLRACEEYGVELLLGSDAPQIYNVPGFAIHHELKYLVDAGLTPYQALKSGTVNVAKFLNRSTSGAVKIGYDSDLVLLAGNPLDNIGNTKKIEGVMIGEKWLSKQYIANELKKIEKK